MIRSLKHLTNDSLYISEITLAELKFGVENSSNIEANRLALSYFLAGVQIMPIVDSLDVFAREKARLRKQGTPLDDFDLLIGSTAVQNHMTLATNNTKHFERINDIKIENWIKAI